MFLIRPASTADLPRLTEFASNVYFINLPREPELLQENLVLSRRSFGLETAKNQGLYIFSLVDTETGDVVGTSCIIERHGTKEAPHTFFQIEKKQVYSKTLKGGFTHEVLVLGFNADGPSEIGGLYLDQAFRRHPDKLGKQIFMVRFMFVKIHRDRFRDQMLAELMGLVTRDGKNPLWEEVGRRFTNLDYPTADRFSRFNKEFILSLFPEGPIYLCMLSPEAREAIGSVHKNTEPARRLVESIGFTYRNQIDPFDGGPHFIAETDRIAPVGQTTRYNGLRAGAPSSDASHRLVAVGVGENFRAAAGPCEIDHGTLVVAEGLFDALKPRPDEAVHALGL